MLLMKNPFKHIQPKETPPPHAAGEVMQHVYLKRLMFHIIELFTAGCGVALGGGRPHGGHRQQAQQHSPEPSNCQKKQTEE
ncbi:MAG: hypothetical protein D6730_05140 [Bacteroidetes bacterium]|nr:MAG: hypothetical protein D6730_05140 [Bacteroidota bacterium]